MITDHSRFLFTEKRSGTDHDSTRDVHGEGPGKEGLRTEGKVMHGQSSDGSKGEWPLRRKDAA